MDITESSRYDHLPHPPEKGGDVDSYEVEVLTGHGQQDRTFWYDCMKEHTDQD